MTIILRILPVVAFAAALSLHETLNAAAPAAPPPQEMIQLPIRAFDAEGKPVAGATVIPWALRSSQGHGPWSVNGQGGSEPPAFTTDAEGRADTLYPRYANSKERVQTTVVTLSIEHPQFVRLKSESIEVPRKEQRSHEITLHPGAMVELVPLLNGKPAPLEQLYVAWSESRPGGPSAATRNGAFLLPRMRAGNTQALVAKIDGGRVTHFSPILDFNLSDGEKTRVEAELRPAVRINGRLSDNVPRPIKNGRISASTLPKQWGRNLDWITWSPVADDGTFVIDVWPESEDVQIIALCDGFIAASGDVPKAAQNQGVSNLYQLPQVFSFAQFGKPLLLEMEPMVRCEIETVDQLGAPLAGTRVMSSPNVRWWNGGSQVYCTPLVRGEQVLVNQDFSASVDHSFADPFTRTTNTEGRATMELPSGRENLGAVHADFELPVNRGRRALEVKLVAGETAKVRLVLQPKGTEYLGDWDKLAGVLFGCTGENCRRLLEDPGFRSKMVEVGKQFDDAPDPTDPALLRQAYDEIAAGFEVMKDQDEANKWRRKSADQAAKLALPAEVDPTENHP